MLVRMTAEMQTFPKVSFVNEQLTSCKAELYPRRCKVKTKKEEAVEKEKKILCKNKIKWDRLILISTNKWRKQTYKVLRKLWLYIMDCIQ